MSLQNSIEVDSDEPVQELYATGIDSMLEALEIANQKSDKASLGQRAAGIDAHPERRFKAALEKYIEDELPVIRKEVRLALSSVMSDTQKLILSPCVVHSTPDFDCSSTRSGCSSPSRSTSQTPSTRYAPLQASLSVWMSRESLSSDARCLRASYAAYGGLQRDQGGEDRPPQGCVPYLSQFVPPVDDPSADPVHNLPVCELHSVKRRQGCPTQQGLDDAKRSRAGRMSAPYLFSLTPSFDSVTIRNDESFAFLLLALLQPG